MLFQALLGDTDGRGAGRNSPYIDVPVDNIVVLDGVSNRLRQATCGERLDARRDKYVLDPWGEPYWYRARAKSTGAEAQLILELWSTGPDRENQHLKAQPGDDIVTVLAVVR